MPYMSCLKQVKEKSWRDRLVSLFSKSRFIHGLAPCVILRPTIQRPHASFKVHLLIVKSKCTYTRISRSSSWQAHANLFDDVHKRSMTHQCVSHVGLGQFRIGLIKPMCQPDPFPLYFQ